MRDLLRGVAAKALADTGSTTLYAEDRLDDGSKIALTINIDKDAGQSEWNFAGTSPQVKENSGTNLSIDWLIDFFRIKNWNDQLIDWLID